LIKFVVIQQSVQIAKALFNVALVTKILKNFMVGARWRCRHDDLQAVWLGVRHVLREEILSYPNPSRTSTRSTNSSME